MAPFILKKKKRILCKKQQQQKTCHVTPDILVFSEQTDTAWTGRAVRGGLGLRMLWLLELLTLSNRLYAIRRERECLLKNVCPLPSRENCGRSER